MKAAEIQRLIVERRERAIMAGGFQAIANWLQQQHGVAIDAKTVEQLYIASASAAAGSGEPSAASVRP